MKELIQKIKEKEVVRPIDLRRAYKLETGVKAHKGLSKYCDWLEIKLCRTLSIDSSITESERRFLLSKDKQLVFQQGVMYQRKKQAEWLKNTTK